MADYTYHDFDHSGANLYLVIRLLGPGTVRDHSLNPCAFVEPVVGNWLNYSIAGAETPASSGFFLFTVPIGYGALAAGMYVFEVYRRIGAQAAASDLLLAQAYLAWTGTEFKDESAPVVAITAQEIRDAMKLAPSADPAPEGGSIDQHLDDGATAAAVTAQAIRDAMKLAPTAEPAPEGGSIDQHLDDAATSEGLADLRTHGDSAWATDAWAGSGDTAVTDTTLDTDGDGLRVMHSGAGVDEVTIRAYLKSEFDAGGRTVRGTAVTGTDGKWIAPMYLDAGTYTLVFSKPGTMTTFTTTVTVS